VATVPSEMTFVAGEVLTAAQMNTNVRDAVNFIIAPPLAQLVQAVVQSVGDSAWTALTFTTETIDRDGGHSNVTNTPRYTAQTAGWYLMQGTVSWTANATGGRQASFGVNGSSTLFSKVFQAGTAAFVGSVTTSGTTYLNVGDYAQLFSWQNSGGANNTVINTESGPVFTLRWVST
jgi:hypothetical protein